MWSAPAMPALSESGGMAAALHKGMNGLSGLFFRG
jgi:hypothetical protein